MVNQTILNKKNNLSVLNVALLWFLSAKRLLKPEGSRFSTSKYYLSLFLMRIARQKRISKRQNVFNFEKKKLR